MRLLLQKVRCASVSVDGDVIASIASGYVLFLGVLRGDTSAQAELLAEKVSKLRLFDGKNGKINDQSVLEIEGEILVVSQFTLAGKTEKGSRPDYTQAEDPESAKVLYTYFIKKLTELGVQRVESGEFGAHMQVELMNDGPVTLMLER